MAHTEQAAGQRQGRPRWPGSLRCSADNRKAAGPDASGGPGAGSTAAPGTTKGLSATSCQVSLPGQARPAGLGRGASPTGVQGSRGRARLPGWEPACRSFFNSATAGTGQHRQPGRHPEPPWASQHPSHQPPCVRGTRPPQAPQAARSPVPEAQVPSCPVSCLRPTSPGTRAERLASPLSLWPGPRPCWPSCQLLGPRGAGRALPPTPGLSPHSHGALARAPCAQRAANTQATHRPLLPSSCVGRVSRQGRGGRRLN